MFSSVDQVSVQESGVEQTSIISPTGKVNTHVLNENYPAASQQKGQLLFHQGAYPHGIYYIHSGVCKVYREGGDAKEKIPVHYDGKKMEVGFNAKYLIDTLSTFDDGEISLELNNELSPVLIKSQIRPNYLGIIMPLKL